MPKLYLVRADVMVGNTLPMYRVRCLMCAEDNKEAGKIARAYIHEHIKSPHECMIKSICEGEKCMLADDIIETFENIELLKIWNKM